MWTSMKRISLFGSVMLLVVTGLFAQTQLGRNINGDGAGDQFADIEGS